MGRETDDAAYRLADAVRSGEAAVVRTVLHSEAAAVCDSAGLVPALTGTFHGAQDVARLITLLWRMVSEADLTVEAVNGRPGLVLRRAAGQAVAVIAVEANGTDISILWIVLNRDKLSRWHRFPESC